MQNEHMESPKPITKFIHLSKAKRAEIENEMDALVTNPKTGCEYGFSGMVLAKSDETGIYPWLQLESWEGANIIFNPSRPENMIRFDRLPQRIELLLGVIHREFFELYKEVIEND